MLSASLGHCHVIFSREFRFLKDYKGYLQVDGYASYHSLSQDIVIVGCFAHARRKFDEALTVIPESDRQGSKAQEGLLFCNALFDVERGIADLRERHAATPEEITRIRTDRSIPLLNEFHDWLVMLEPQTLPKSKIGTAVHYAIEQWNYLQNYLLDPRLEISNNLAERSIRSFCIGRKNHLFSDTQNGAYASATIYSLVETAKENNLKPYEYFKFLLSALPAVDFPLQPELLDDFLPWSDKIPDICRIPNTSMK